MNFAFLPLTFDPFSPATHDPFPYRDIPFYNSALSPPAVATSKITLQSEISPFFPSSQRPRNNFRAKQQPAAAAPPTTPIPPDLTPRKRSRAPPVAPGAPSVQPKKSTFSVYYYTKITNPLAARLTNPRKITHIFNMHPNATAEIIRYNITFIVLLSCNSSNKTAKILRYTYTFFYTFTL